MATNKNADVYREDRSQDSNHINIKVYELEQSTAEKYWCHLQLIEMGLSYIKNSFWMRKNQRIYYKSFNKVLTVLFLSKNTLAFIIFKFYIHF